MSCFVEVPPLVAACCARCGTVYLMGAGPGDADLLFLHAPRMLAQADVEVVTGVAVPCGVGSHAGTPLTHRAFAQRSTFVTGRLKDGSYDLDWPAMARPRHTVVIDRGLSGLATICGRLVAHGFPPEWPEALVAQGTLAEQRTVCASLGTLADAEALAGLQSPCLTMLGEVVRLPEQLNWFEQHRASACQPAEGALTCP